MLKKSPIILLDEATSSLDSETEEKIQNAINILTKNKTTVVIAHRLSTILNSNKIFVVENGKIITSSESWRTLDISKQYKSFYEKQIKKIIMYFFISFYFFGSYLFTDYITNQIFKR